MEIKLPDTTTVTLTIGEDKHEFDLVEWNDKIFEIQERHPQGDSWEKDYIAEFRLFVRQTLDLALSHGQAVVLANTIMKLTNDMLKKLDQ